MGILSSLFGIGKAILGWGLALLRKLLEFCQSHPLLAFMIALDLALVAGCIWGYARHRDAQAKAVQIEQLRGTIKEKDSLIEQLYARLKEYVEALRESQDEHVASIKRNNQAVEQMKAAADAQVAKALAEAEKTRAQRDSYFQLSQRYRNALKTGGTPEQRIASEERINNEFIRDYRRVR